MGEVTVRATQSIAGFVDGEVKTIERTRFIDRLIANQSLSVVSEEPVAIDTVESASQDLSDAERSEAEAAADLAAAQVAAKEQLDELDKELVPPKRSANRADWAEFLGIPAEDIRSKAELIADYDRTITDEV